jgi:hypothetical protein
MNKVKLIGLVLFLGLSFQASAKAGVANGGLEFALVIIAFLLLVAGFLEAIDYFRKNGKDLFHKAKAFIRRKIMTLHDLLNKTTLRHFGVPFF